MTEACIPVPPPTATWSQIWTFALTFNGYDRCGGFGRLADIANPLASEWRATGRLQADLDTLRAALFFEQRRYRHVEAEPTREAAAYIRELVARISQKSGGTVPGPPDELP